MQGAEDVAGPPRGGAYAHCYPPPPMHQSTAQGPGAQSHLPHMCGATEQVASPPHTHVQCSRRALVQSHLPHMCGTAGRSATLALDCVAGEATAWRRLPLSRMAVSAPLTTAGGRKSHRQQLSASAAAAAAAAMVGGVDQRAGVANPLPLLLLPFPLVKSCMLALTGVTAVHLPAAVQQPPAAALPGGAAAMAGGAVVSEGGRGVAVVPERPLALVLRGAAELDAAAPLRCPATLPHLISGTCELYL